MSRSKTQNAIISLVGASLCVVFAGVSTLRMISGFIHGDDSQMTVNFLILNGFAWTGIAFSRQALRQLEEEEKEE